MEYKDFFAGLKTDIETERAGLDQKSADLDSAMADVDLKLKSEHAAGVEEGKGMIELPTPQDPAAQYTQEAMNAAVTSGMEQQRAKDEIEFQPQIDALKGQVSDLQAKIDQAGADKEQAMKDMEAKLESTIADLKAKFDAMLSKEKAAEDEFEANLAPTV